ncbi:MAG TPA: hypothetical protein VKB08_12500 [Bradyrhizobium sp.]|nr:hypothetical protein [Bradyrhizobium sp.]
MPVARYFLLIGSLLLAMLFIADWSLPDAPQSFMRDARVDKSIIRIKSAHRWPEKVVYDTTLPTIVPSPSPVLAELPARKQAREEIAELIAPLPQASNYPAPAKTKRMAIKKSAVTRMAAYRGTPEPLPAGW